MAAKVAARKRIMMRRSTLKANPEKMRAWKQRSKPLKAKSSLQTKTSFTAKPSSMKKGSLTSRTTLKAKKRIRKVGRVGKANIESRAAIAKKAEAMKLTSCEVGPILLQYGINVCLYNFALAPAHRHKRAWYKGDAEKLADVKQWVAACQCCHDAIEHSKDLTEAVFKSLRGEE